MNGSEDRGLRVPGAPGHAMIEVGFDPCPPGDLATESYLQPFVPISRLGGGPHSSLQK